MECRNENPESPQRALMRYLGGPAGPFVISCAVVLSFALWQPDRLEIPYRPEAGAHLACRLLRVLDGDTIDVRCPGGRSRVRLWGMDAPEHGQVPWGAEARDSLAGLLEGTRVRLRVRDRDRYGRTVAQVYSDAGDAGLLMVRRGLASVRTRYVRDLAYRRALIRARAERVGIWSVTGWHQEPWVWRRYNPTPSRPDEGE